VPGGASLVAAERVGTGRAVRSHHAHHVGSPAAPAAPAGPGATSAGDAGTESDDLAAAMKTLTKAKEEVTLP
jgi:hypothetical protein